MIHTTIFLELSVPTSRMGLKKELQSCRIESEESQLSWYYCTGKVWGWLILPFTHSNEPAFPLASYMAFSWPRNTSFKWCNDATIQTIKSPFIHVTSSLTAAIASWDKEMLHEWWWHKDISTLLTSIRDKTLYIFGPYFYTYWRNAKCVHFLFRGWNRLSLHLRWSTVPSKFRKW